MHLKTVLVLTYPDMMYDSSYFGLLQEWGIDGSDTVVMDCQNRLSELLVPVAMECGYKESLIEGSTVNGEELCCHWHPSTSSHKTSALGKEGMEYGPLHRQQKMFGMRVNLVIRLSPSVQVLSTLLMLIISHPFHFTSIGSCLTSAQMTWRRSKSGWRISFVQGWTDPQARDELVLVVLVSCFGGRVLGHPTK